MQSNIAVVIRYYYLDATLLANVAIVVRIGRLGYTTFKEDFTQLDCMSNPAGAKGLFKAQQGTVIVVSFGESFNRLFVTNILVHLGHIALLKERALRHVQ